MRSVVTCLATVSIAASACIAQTTDPRLAAFADPWADITVVRTTWARQFESVRAPEPRLRFSIVLSDSTLGRPYEHLGKMWSFTRAEPFPPEDLPGGIEYWVLTNPEDRVVRDGNLTYRASDGLWLQSTTSTGVAGGNLHSVTPTPDVYLAHIQSGPHALAWWVLEHPADAARARVEDLPGGGVRVAPGGTDRTFVLEPRQGGYVLVRAEHAPSMRDMDGAVFIERFEDYADLPGLPPFPRRRVGDTPNLRQMPDGLLVYEHDRRNVVTAGLIRAERLDAFPPEIPEQVRARAETQGVTRGVSLKRRNDPHASRIENGRFIQPPPLGSEPAPEPLADTTKFLRWGGVGVLALGLGWLVWRWKAGRV